MPGDALKTVTNVLVQNIAQQLMNTGARGVIIVLIGEDEQLSTGTCMLSKSATLRDLVIGVNSLSNTQKVLSSVILENIDDGRGTGGARESGTGVGSPQGVGDVPDRGSPTDKPETVGEKPATAEQAGQPS